MLRRCRCQRCHRHRFTFLTFIVNISIIRCWIAPNGRYTEAGPANLLRQIRFDVRGEGLLRLPLGAAMPARLMAHREAALDHTGCACRLSGLLVATLARLGLQRLAGPLEVKVIIGRVTATD